MESHSGNLHCLLSEASRIQSPLTLAEHRRLGIGPGKHSLRLPDAFQTGPPQISAFQGRFLKCGIGQIAMVVQNNSAAAQETSAMSEELSTQANNLEKVVEQFTLR